MPRVRFMVTMDVAVLARLNANAEEVGAARSHVIESAVLAHLDGEERGAVGARARQATIAGATGMPLPMKRRPVNGRKKEPEMNSADVIAEGERVAAELRRLKAQYTASVEADYKDFALTVPQMNANAERYATRLRERVAEVRERWLDDANDRLRSLNANPPPPPVKDPRSAFYVLHRLVGLPAAERLRAITNAVDASDRLTFDTVCQAPPYIDLLPAADLERVKRRWNERHSIHPRRGYHELATVVQTVTELLVELEGCVPAQPVAA